MESLNRLTARIHVMNELQGVVRTMKTLAAVNVRQLEGAVESLADYTATIERGFQVVLRGEPELLEWSDRDRPAGSLAVVAFGTDRGLCGPLTEHMVEALMTKLPEWEPDAGRRLILAVGLRLADRLESQGIRVLEKVSAPDSPAGVAPLVQDLLARILSLHADGHIDRFRLLYTAREMPMGFHPESIELLPIDLRKYRSLGDEPWPSKVLPIYTMGWKELLAALIRQDLFVSIFRACAEALASENLSRLRAMENAEQNLQERSEELHLEYQQQRQSIVSSQLLDIIGGYEVAAGGRENPRTASQAAPPNNMRRNA